MIFLFYCFCLAYIVFEKKSSVFLVFFAVQLMCLFSLASLNISLFITGLIILSVPFLGSVFTD